MKCLILCTTFLLSFNTFAFTQAEAVRAAFNSEQFIESLGSTKIESIEVKQADNDFEVIVNQAAPLVDGCAYTAQITSETFAIDPLTSGVRLSVFSTDKKCGW